MNPHPETQTGSEAVNGACPAITEKQRLVALGRQSLLAAYWRDLAKLIQEHPGQWVAYHGDTQLGIGPTGYALWQECERRGYKNGEFLIRSIEPEDPDLLAGFDQPVPPGPG